MAADNDKILDDLKKWKERVHAAFLLIASILGAAALLLLEAGVVAKAWNLNFGSAYNLDTTASWAIPSFGVAEAAEKPQHPECACQAPLKKATAAAKKRKRGNPRGLRASCVRE